MKIRDQEAHAKSVQANSSDPYGSCILKVATAWADEMEKSIAGGAKVADIASAAFTKVDEGITGFMYGCAVGFLAATWEHGEELRRWHNKDTQIGDEGDRANEKGTVLNPALLTVG